MYLAGCRLSLGTVLIAMTDDVAQGQVLTRVLTRTQIDKGLQMLQKLPQLIKDLHSASAAVEIVANVSC